MSSVKLSGRRALCVLDVISVAMGIGSSAGRAVLDKGSRSGMKFNSSSGIYSESLDIVERAIGLGDGQYDGLSAGASRVDLRVR